MFLVKPLTFSLSIRPSLGRLALQYDVKLCEFILFIYSKQQNMFTYMEVYITSILFIFTNFQTLPSLHLRNNYRKNSLKKISS